MNNRRLYYDIIRICACFFVIINHSIYAFDKYGEISTINWMTSNYLFFISKMAVPLFIMMTGALILDKEETYKSIYINRFFKTGIILFIWSIIYLTFYKERMLNINDIITMTKDIIKKPISIHFWYLYMLLGLYLMTPFIRKMIKNFNRQDYFYYFIFWAIFSLLVPFVRIFKKFQYSSYLGIQIFTGYIGYYILGNYIDKIKITKRKFLCSCFLFVISIILSSTLTYYLSFISGKTSRALDNVLMPTIVISSVCYFIIIKYLFNNKLENNISDWLKKVLFNISSKTFGIYLVHMLLLGLINKTNTYIKITSSSINPILIIILYDLIIFLIAYLITSIIKNIPLIKNIV